MKPRIHEPRYTRSCLFFLLILHMVLMTGCVFSPSKSYDGARVNYIAYRGLDSAHAATQTVTVEANKAWQPSGVELQENSKVKILAMGKWSPWPALNIWSGPEGNPKAGKEVPWITSSALMAKIGENGKPFEIGNEREFQATEQGLLYLAINDPFGYLSDNTGSLQVTIHTISPASETPPTSVSAPVSTAAAARNTTTQKRTALVIGNSHYDVGVLRNPANDAQDIARTLEQLGFHVTLSIDATQEQMETAISEFGRSLYLGGVGLFYYAGHGVQVDGENYLIPVRARIESESDVRYRGVHVGQILGKMGEARNGFNVIILDACRDNPFARSFRSSTRGLAVVRDAAPQGTLIAYATSPGNVASDGDESNGLYTKHLLQNMVTPNLSIEQVFKRVLQGVERETNGKQTPWTSSSFSGDFYFVRNAS
ncbi:MAG: caspase family protein [Nitrospirales bacterium]|nr:caspase family protein [Nitrospira sp.]MDR4501203.1 caspase family protein [Nitrospirales bacterium]